MDNKSVDGCRRVGLSDEVTPSLRWCVQCPDVPTSVYPCKPQSLTWFSWTKTCQAAPDLPRLYRGKKLSFVILATVMIDGPCLRRWEIVSFYDWTQRNPFRKLLKHTSNRVISQSRHDFREYFLSSTWFVSLLRHSSRCLTSMEMGNWDCQRWRGTQQSQQGWFMKRPCKHRLQQRPLHSVPNRLRLCLF